jgi:hypothetical protein
VGPLRIPDGIWVDLVDDARWAPSPHNLQSWLVRVRGPTDAELLYDPARALPQTDPLGRFVTVGLGVFVESLALAAASRGLALAVTYEGARIDAGARRPAPFAGLSLAPADVGEPLPVSLLRERRTSRLPYDGRAVPERVLEELRTLARSGGHELRWSSDRTLVNEILALNEETLFFDMTDATARREVGRWLRFSAAEAAQRGDGFSPAALGFPGPLLNLFFRAHRLAELPGVRDAVHGLYRRTMRGTPTIAWLQGPFEQPEDWLATGRLLQRLWLTLTKHGVRLHPFGSIVTNADANACAHELLDLRPAPEAGTFWLAARLGYSAEPPRSHRLETEQLLVP